MIDFKQIKHFTESEFQGQVDLLEPSIVYNLDTLRNRSNERIFISPAQGSIARFYGSKTSQHYVGPSPQKILRKSTAIDVFMEGIPFVNFILLNKLNLFSAVGIYLDTSGPDGKPWVMFHLDQRKNIKNIPLVWVAHNIKDSEGNILYRQYSYPANDKSIWRLLQRDIFFINKTM